MASAKIRVMASTVVMGRFAHSADVSETAAIKQGALMVSDASKAIVFQIDVQTLTASLARFVVRKAIQQFA